MASSSRSRSSSSSSSRTTGGSWGRSRVNGEGDEREERRGEQAGLERLELRVLVVVDDAPGWWRRRARPSGRRPAIWSEATKSMPVPTATLTCAGDLVADALVGLDLRHEDAGEAGQHDRPDQGDAERGAELLAGVLQAAGLAPARGVDRRLHHVAELGDDEAHPDAEDGHRRWRRRRRRGRA